MAHSSAGELYFLYQDESGEVRKVARSQVKQRGIKQEIQSSPTQTSTVYTSNNSNMGAYNQINTSTNNSQYNVRLPKYGYNLTPLENATYTVIATNTDASNSSVPQQTNNCSSSSSTPKNEITHDDEDYKAGLVNSRNVKSPTERSMTKYTQNFNSNAKLKSKINKTISTPASVQRKRKPDKAGKGLRHFSNKVCEKVKKKGRTTYNEVADELVEEEMQNSSCDAANCDQKNIRRRVYDALNVLMAMKIISKDKKEIRWIGLPSNSMDQCAAVEKEQAERRARINKKHQQLWELVQQHLAFKSLVNRNKEAESQGIVPASNSSIQLPFIIVNTHKSTNVHCSVANDKSEYFFKFDDQFEMHDDAQVLKRMGFLSGLDNGHCSYEDIERAKKMVPPNFEKYIEAYGSGKGLNSDSDEEYAGVTNTEDDSQGFSRIENDDDDDTTNTHELDNEEEYMSDVD